MDQPQSFTIDIYLDQNHWISLARAFHKRDSNPPLNEVAKLASDAASAGRARFLISRLHLIEAAKSTNEAQRERLIAAFLHFGRGWILRPAEVIYAEELLSWSRGDIPRANSAVGRGLLAAFLDYEHAARYLNVSPSEIDETDQFGDSFSAWHFALL